MSQLGSLVQYATVVAAGVASLLAGASTVHFFAAPDLTLPPPPEDLARRLREAEEATGASAARPAK